MSPKTEDFKDVCHMTGCKTAKHHNNIPVTASFWSLTHPLFPLWAKVRQRPSDNDVFPCDKDTSFKCHRIIWFSSHICISHLSFHVDNLNKSVFCFHSLSSETGTLLFHVSCVCDLCSSLIGHVLFFFMEMSQADLSFAFKSEMWRTWMAEMEWNYLNYVITSVKFTCK